MTVNQLVVGSIPTAGANKIDTLADTARCFFYLCLAMAVLWQLLLIFTGFFLFSMEIQRQHIGDTETAHSYGEFKRRRALSWLFSHILNQLDVIKQQHAICKALYSRKISGLL